MIILGARYLHEQKYARYYLLHYLKYTSQGLGLSGQPPIYGPVLS